MVELDDGVLGSVLDPGSVIFAECLAHMLATIVAGKQPWQHHKVAPGRRFEKRAKRIHSGCRPVVFGRCVSLEGFSQLIFGHGPAAFDPFSLGKLIEFLACRIIEVLLIDTFGSGHVFAYRLEGHR